LGSESSRRRPFRKNGIAGTGLSDLIAAAGLTHGGFYRNFDSKDQIVAEAFTAAADSSAQQLAASASEKSRRGLKKIVETYLSAAHNRVPRKPFAEYGRGFFAVGHESPQRHGRGRPGLLQSTVERLHLGLSAHQRN